MLWIYGGGYYLGSTDLYPAQILAAFNDVIVVTVNYRLNIFGFFSGPGSGLVPNLGLWDQHLAMLWVKNNIDDYGGDSSSVTLFGESAGGSAVIQQMFSPHNDLDLFQRVISESAYLLGMTVLNRDTSRDIKTLAKALDCGSAQLVSCMKEKTTSQLLLASYKQPIYFYPVADDDYLPKDLGYMMSNFTAFGVNDMVRNNINSFAKFDLFGGWNNQNGLLFMGNLLSVSEAVAGKDLTNGVDDRVLHRALSGYPFEHLSGTDVSDGGEALTTIINFYMQDVGLDASKNRSVSDRRVEAFMKITGT